MEIQWLELWFFGFFRSAIAMSERRIVLGVHATVSTMLGAFGLRYGNTEVKQSGGRHREGFNCLKSTVLLKQRPTSLLCGKMAVPV